MKDWLSETIDQIALGEILADSTVSCGQRFGLIAIDNAVEFMLIAYVEVYKHLVGDKAAGKKPKKEWEETKRYFPALLAFVTEKEPNLQPLVSDITNYHNHRNDLYHTGTPLTTAPRHVHLYAKVAKQVLGVLFSMSLSDDEWTNVVAQNVTSLCGGIGGPPKRQMTFEVIDSLVRFTAPTSPSATDAIALTLFGYSTRTGAPPSKPSLIQSLARSGHPLSPDIVNARLHDLKAKGWLQTHSLALSARGRKALEKKYLLDV